VDNDISQTADISSLHVVMK